MLFRSIRFENGRRVSNEAVISLGSAEGKGGANDNKGSTKGTDNAKDSAKDNAKDSGKDKEPYSVLSWQDQVEIATRPSRRAGG